MGLNFVNKTINKSKISCDEKVQVTLSLSASPDISKNPTDIVLVLDRSGSMQGQPLTFLKKGAKQFIDIIEKSTDSSQDGVIGGGSRMGIVSFASEATKDTGLITDVQQLKNAVDNLVARNGTNHKDAFEKAIELFDANSNNAKVLVLFTDGKTTVGGNASPTAALARSLGIEVYCIGFVGDAGIDENILNDWASDPDSTHVIITPTFEDLEELFKTLAENIVKTGATNIVIDEMLNKDFIISELFSPSKGNVEKVNSRNIKWSINELGVTGIESASLSFLAQYTGTSSKTENINESITYSDSEGNNPKFQNPIIEIDCGINLEVETCPIKNNMSIDKCIDGYLEYNLGDVFLDSTGQIVEANLTLKSVCPRKRVALAVMLTEKDDSGTEYKRGMKVMTVPAHREEMCKDININKIRFILPNDISLNALCGERALNLKAMAHYIDSGYDCEDLPV